MTGSAILVVDDEPDIRTLVQEILEDEGYEVETASTLEEARVFTQDRTPALVLLDIWMPDGDGISLLKEWKAGGTLAFPVVIMSGHGSVETAVEATRLGAYDFLEKPLSLAKLILTVSRALEADRLARENLGLRQQLERSAYPEGESRVMQDLRAQVRRIAQHDTWVLVSGEAGTGKQTFARYLHSQSNRSARPFVEVAVASLAPDESAVELLGQEQGDRVRQGLLERAHGGILFLDEVADMDLQVQGRLLNALEQRSITRVGGSEPVAVDVRVVAATQRDLEELVREDAFREDLYYRLSVVPLKIPPLREHLEDVPVLVDHFVASLHEREGLPLRRFTSDAIQRLRHHDWPGNVRELRSVVQRLLILGSGDDVSGSEVEFALSGRGLRGTSETVGPISTDLPLREAREEFERGYLLQQLERAEGNMTRLAERVGLERTHLYRKLKALGIEPRKSRSDN
ncbi:transcriptional regulator [Thioalkalivibrio denitrificans]|uniref:Transcriptional regulator n=1 Tax=Thioalkalivibrio denitrificans TaxID=108003 RepID=A0A1V3NUW0_9GAMM|nr:sigma-54 dependent transcriptional regulator [Thioalkalivibrio denitrificans]OOG28658.1 transcriptional regulator [Thioalkalivibrio denitrificans]